jgi:hypothetical protein
MAKKMRGGFGEEDAMGEDEAPKDMKKSKKGGKKMRGKGKKGMRG